MNHAHLIKIAEQPKMLAKEIEKKLGWKIHSVALEEFESDAGIAFTNKVSIQIALYHKQPFHVSYWDGKVFHLMGSFGNVNSLIDSLKSIEQKIKEL